MGAAIASPIARDTWSPSMSPGYAGEANERSSPEKNEGGESIGSLIGAALLSQPVV